MAYPLEYSSPLPCRVNGGTHGVWPLFPSRVGTSALSEVEHNEVHLFDPGGSLVWESFPFHVATPPDSETHPTILGTFFSHLPLLCLIL